MTQNQIRQVTFSVHSLTPNAIATTREASYIREADGQTSCTHFWIPMRFCNICYWVRRVPLSVPMKTNTKRGSHYFWFNQILAIKCGVWF